MSLASRIAARSRRPTATIRLGGRRWFDVLSLSREQTYGQGISGGTVVGRNPPVSIVEGETTISWRWGYDGHEVAGFDGVVSQILQRSYPNQWSLQVADPLWLADIQRRDIATDPLNSVPASDAIEQILLGAGLSRLAIPDLPASGSAWAGSEWVLGTLTPVVFPNTTALQAAQSIAGVLGYWLFADASGVVRAVQMERRPSSSPFRTLRYGEDFLLAGPPERKRDAAAVRNRVVVRGANTGIQGAQIKDEWTTGAGDRSLEYQSGLIEYVNEAEAGEASATAVARRLVALHSRKPNIITVGKLKADPRLAVGATVAIQCALIGYSSPVPFFIYQISTTLDLRAGDFAQSLTLDGGTGDAGYTTIPPPLASFTWRIVRETLEGVGVVELFLDGSGSASLSSGEIVSWDWASATATQSPFPDTASGVRAMFAYPAATPTAEVTLTVTDTSSKTGSITQTIDLTGDGLTAPTTRTISLALGAAWAATPDGGNVWNVEAAGDSTLVPEFGGDSLLSTAGTGSTGLRQSLDALATASSALASLGGQITALDQTRGAPDRVWAAVGADLYKSTDGGATFAAWGTLPGPIAGVLEDPALPDSVFVLSGNTMYQSTSPTNPGTAWVPLYVGPAGATARQLVRGLSGATTWVAYEGTFTGSPLHRVEGPITVAFPVDAAPPVSEIRALAMNDAETALYAWDQEGRIWIVDAQSGVGPTLSTQSHDAAETVQHALHDPDDDIVYVATFGATEGTAYKYFPLADLLLPFYVPAAGQQAHRVGLGGQAARGFGLLLIPDQAAGADDVIWRYRDGAWAGITPPQAGWRWLAIRAAPFSPETWLLLGNTNAATAQQAQKFDVVGGVVKARGTSDSPLYLTTDGGATWTPITLTHPFEASYTANDFSVASIAGEYLAWDVETGGRWLLHGGSDNVGSVGNARWVWRGDGATAPAPTHQAGDAFGALVSGAENEAVVHTIFPDGYVYYETAGGAWAQPAGASPDTTSGYTLAREPGPSRRVALNSGSLWLTADYRAAQPSSVGGVGIGQGIVWATHGLYGAGGSGGLRRLDLATGAPTPVLSPDSVLSGHASVDAQTRVLVAWRDTTGGLYVYDGEAAAVVAEPGPDLADFVEVIGEGA